MPIFPSSAFDAVDVKDFGAVGDGISNDSTAIAAAIAAAGGQAGGVIIFGPGRYIVSSSLSLPSNIIIRGSGVGTTSIIFSATNQDCFTSIDGSNITIQDMTISGPGSGTGNGINFARSSNSSLPYLRFSNLKILNFGVDGIALSNPIVSSLSNVVCQTNGRYGFNLYGVISGASGTSTTLDSCYANGNVTAGFRLYNMTYCALNACAADSNAIGYLIDTCQSVALSGCGGESNATNTYKVSGGAGITLASCYVYDNRDIAIYVTGNAQLINLIGCTDNTPHSGATNFIKTDSGTLTTIVGCSNVTANSLASSTVATLIDTVASTELLGLTVFGNADLQGKAKIGSSSSIYSASGVPSNGTGSDGDYYLRTDTPGTANQRIYVKSAGAWTGIV